MSSQPATTPAAVFLSYARENAEKARSIATAWRAFGVGARGARSFEFGVLSLGLADSRVPRTEMPSRRIVT